MYWGVRTPAELRLITRAFVIALRKDLKCIGSWRPDRLAGSLLCVNSNKWPHEIPRGLNCSYFLILQDFE